jgi:serine protease Do
VIVSDVTPGGPAESAGLKVGDIVLSADDRRIDTLPALTAAMYLHPLDKVMRLAVLRGSDTKTLEVPVIEHRDSMDKLMDTVDPGKSLIQRLGILAIDLTPELRSVAGEVRIPTGVVVIGRAANLLGPDTGLKTGDIIHSLNAKPIESVDALRASLHGLKPNAPIALQIERDGGLEWLSFEME